MVLSYSEREVYPQGSSQLVGNLRPKLDRFTTFSSNGIYFMTLRGIHARHSHS